MLERFVLRLYVAGAAPRSARAVEALRNLCDDHLRARYELEVIDVYQQPQLARDEHVDVIPVLVKLAPPPVRRIVGDLSDTDLLLRELNLKPRS